MGIYLVRCVDCRELYGGGLYGGEDGVIDMFNFFEDFVFRGRVSGREVSFC